jgi:hypothetical protein
MKIDQEYLDGLKKFHETESKVVLFSREQFDAVVDLAKDGLKLREEASVMEAALQILSTMGVRNSLDVGFRHGPLTLEEYRAYVEEVRRLVGAALRGNL